ncbi:hypothetical protein OG921_26015 [Aldersonia sp. NBC_00410]|uniref:hypothetical protein n=1 Tax=Aldersonia sp. NBC_00410 TaxID=2975954 RepID=UPI0022549DB1|nr:hypothetical protein [Aldersonia sp. NBC_00410]MCX5046634.1 hypothetical protein [Aldersonia sp. NBC_00410]
MFVLTVDQQRSRRDVDRVDDLLADLPPVPMVRGFERTAGDEVQGVTASAEAVVELALDFIRRGHWSIGIGIGSVEEPLPSSTRAGRGPAFEAARRAVDRAKRAPANLAVEGGDDTRAADAETVLTLLALLVARRSEHGHAAVALMRTHPSQSVAADTLGISNQAMSQRLAAAGWHAEAPGRSLAVKLLTEAGAA